VNDKAEVVGSLVEKTDNPQPNVYVMTLRQGIKFQDGTDFNSEAVKFNLERHMNDPKGTRLQDVKDITTIETPDPRTVRITLKAAFAPFTSKLTGGAGYMLSPTAVQKLGDNLQRDLTGAGTGPYKFTQWQKDTQIVLDRNPDYWGKDADGTQLPYLDKIILKPFPNEDVRLTNVKTGDADVLIGPPPYKDIEDLKKDSTLNVKEIAGLGFQFIFVNTQKEPFNNPAVRRALSYAIDREQIKQAVYFGAGRTLQLPVPEVIPWAVYKDNPPYSQREAGTCFGRRQQPVILVPDFECVPAVAASGGVDQGPDQGRRVQHGDPVDRVRDRGAERQHGRVPGAQPRLERGRRPGREPLLVALHGRGVQLRQVQQPAV
jgi:peptide/nickel transport system substrate-binding protein